MNWSTLYSAKRTGDKERKDANPDPVRTSFLRDYDRIIFSSPFRRLQNKTQVFPLPGAVFVHNRLTHSLEVASVGRSLGKAVGEAIALRYEGESSHFEDFYRHELQSVVAAACLSHDIGNPPFGHSGEDAIRNYFVELEGDTQKILNDYLSQNQRKDFEWFEGNSNALRILTHSFNENEPGGYKLTYATLAAIVKYPCSSAEGFDKSTGLIATKKSGYFDSEIPVFEAIAGKLGMLKKNGFDHVYARHPFVYLTEAADDVCYRVIDLEDAHRLHIVSLEKFMSLFLPFFETEKGYNGIEYVMKKLDNINDDNQKVQFIRAKWIGLMVEKLSKIFLEKEKELLGGMLETDLLNCLSENDRELIKRINQFSVQHIYNYRSVVEIEIAGFNIIGGLLKEFVGAVVCPDNARAQKLLQLIPAQFLVARSKEHLYGDIQSVVDFISGMTDLYAIDLYRKITGITIPELR
ncbi:MAG TPA: dNTP triphosphohydrolase [Flavipsychrobacter sp.]|jgi:dGTPase|nr:dNTP triphosphohydrolase [Flavipsychrobacter sp.]